MSRTYTPNKWVILDIDNGKEKMHKILAGWSGGYLDSDEWRMSSPIVNVEERDNHYLVKNHSGSTYICNKNSSGMTTLSRSIYLQIQEGLQEGQSCDILEIEELIKRSNQ